MSLLHPVLFEVHNYIFQIVYPWPDCCHFLKKHFHLIKMGVIFMPPSVSTCSQFDWIELIHVDHQHPLLSAGGALDVSGKAGLVVMNSRAGLRRCYLSISGGQLSWVHYSWQVLWFCHSELWIYHCILLLPSRFLRDMSCLVSNSFKWDPFRMCCLSLTGWYYAMGWSWIKSFEASDLPVLNILCSNWESVVSFIAHPFSPTPLCASFSCVYLWAGLLLPLLTVFPISRVTDPSANICFTAFSFCSPNFHF